MLARRAPRFTTPASHRALPRYSGVVVSARGAADVTHNDVYSNWGPGIALCLHGRARVHRNLLHHGLEAGVLVSSSDAAASIEDNDVCANERPGVVVLANADPSVRGNRFRDGRENGVWVYLSLIHI